MLPDIVAVVPLRDAGLEVVKGEVKGAGERGGDDAGFHVGGQFVARIGAVSHQGRHGQPAAGGGAGRGGCQQLFGTQNPLGQKVRLQRPFLCADLRGGGRDAAGGAGRRSGSALTGRDLNLDVYFPLTANDAMFGDTIVKLSSGSRTETLQLSDMYIRVSRPESVEPTAAGEALIAVRHAGQSDVQVRVPRELLRQAENQQRTWNFIMVAIACLSLLVGGIGIMNISLASVTEARGRSGFAGCWAANERTSSCNS